MVLDDQTGELIRCSARWGPSKHIVRELLATSSRECPLRYAERCRCYLFKVRNAVASGGRLQHKVRNTVMEQGGGYGVEQWLYELGGIDYVCTHNEGVLQRCGL